MFFTQNDYKKIQQWLIKNSVKDTEFNEANIPFNGEETITIVQGNQNKKVFLKDLIAQVFNLGISDFVNITDKYDAPNISLEEAIRLIPSRARKEGQVITFLDMEDHWHIYQFKGVLNQWNVLDTWEDLFDWEKLIINSILPDEEDLTKSPADENGNSYLSLKDREYNPEDFSGLGRVILRKNIVEVEDPIYGKVKKNVLYQDMINKENTIYEIRYDFDLNGAEITIPEGCVLDFQGGSIYTTKTIKSSNSNITIKGKGSIIGKDVDTFLEFSEAKNISISGISFKSSEATECFAVRCFGVSNFRIENCSCENMYLIHSESLTKNYNTTTKENSNYGFSVVNNYVKNTHTRTNVAAIFLGYCYNFIVNNNIVETNSMGCTIWGGDAINNILVPEDEHKAGDGVVSNNTFDCKQAGAWAGASKNVVFNSNIVKNTTAEALDAESCKDVMFTNNVLVDVNMGLNLFGYVDNIIFDNNIVTLKGTNRISIYQSHTQTIEKQGNLEVTNNKFMLADTNDSCLCALASLASFKFIGNECTNMYYNGYSAGTIITKDNHFIYTIKRTTGYWIRTGIIRSIYEKNKNNLCCVIENNLFENKADNLTDRILWLDYPYEVEQDVYYSISNNTFINTTEAVFVNDLSSLTSRLEIKFHNNKYNNLRYPIYIVNNESNNVLFFNWRNNTDLSNKDLFYEGVERNETHSYNIKFAKGSIINLQFDYYKQEIFEVAISDTAGNVKSNWKRIDLSSTFGYESDRPQNINGGNLFFDRTLDKPIWYNGDKWIESDGNNAGVIRAGASENRPRYIKIGTVYFDTAISKPIWWTGTKWVDATGADV